MKKILLIFATGLACVLICNFLIQCAPPSSESNVNQKEVKEEKTSVNCVTILTIDGHEYILYDDSEGSGLCHSESCPSMHHH
jgi:hypothetical protein